MIAAPLDYFAQFRRGPWAIESDWQSYLDHDPRSAIALGALRKALPESKLVGCGYSQLAFDHWTVTGRWRLLEAGLALAHLPHWGEFPGRLRRADAYSSVLAELDAALVLWALGFAVVHEPVKTLELAGTSNPDWLAIRDGLAFGVEVKCPRVSKKVLGRENVIAEIIKTGGLIAPEMTVDLHLDASGLDSVTNGDWVNSKEVQELTLDAFAKVEGQQVSRNRLGEFRRSATTTRFEGFAIDENAELARLREDIESAALQLKVLPPPGIIFLSTIRDSMVRYRSYAIREILCERWARDIGCVLVTTPTSPGFIVECVPGERFAELPDLRARRCNDGHSHIDSFIPRSLCTLSAAS